MPNVATEGLLLSIAHNQKLLQLQNSSHCSLHGLLVARVVVVSHISIHIVDSPNLAVQRSNYSQSLSTGLLRNKVDEHRCRWRSGWCNIDARLHIALSCYTSVEWLAAIYETTAL
jgi:hypothetical protein